MFTKPNSLRNVISCCLLLVALSNLSVAQQDITATANIPFDFWVEGTHFQAGDYFIDKSEPAMIIIRSKDNKTTEQAGTILYGDPVSQANAHLIFVKISGHFELAEIWGLLGKRVLTSHYGHGNGADTRIVQLQYPSNNQAPGTRP